MPLVLDEPGLQTADLVVNGLGVMGNLLPDGCLLEASADGTDWGNPEAVISSIASQLQDGSLESHDRDDNREASVYLKLSAPGVPDPGRAIGIGQRTVELACEWPAGQVREMRWTSPLAGAQTTVFEMTTATVQRRMESDWDLDERLSRYRTFTLSIHARPHVRGTAPVTIPAIDASGTTTITVDDGSSTTGWEVVETAPDPMRNLEPNPDFATTVSGYSPGAGTRTPITWWTASGATYAEMQVDTPAMVPNGRSYINGPLHTVAAGDRVEIGAVVPQPLDGGTGVTVRFYNNAAGTAQIGTDWTLAPQRGAAPISWTITVPAGAIRMRVYRFGQQGASLLASPWRLDKQWTTIATPSPVTGWVGYFDGNSTDTAALTYTWDGTANASTSTATWSDPILDVNAGAVRGVAFGRLWVTIRRAAAIDMSALAYMWITGTASTYASNGVVTVSPAGGDPIAPESYAFNPATGVFAILIRRPEGFPDGLDVRYARVADAPDRVGGPQIRVESIKITNSPFGGGRTQSRQVQVYGSQRTEVSLDVQGMDADGVTPVGLGPQVLVATATAGDDSRAKILAVRAAATVNKTPTADATATSGAYNALATVASTNYPTFSLDSATLLPGTFDVYGTLEPTAAGSHTVSLRAELDTGLDTVRVGTWQDTLFTTGTVWPMLPVNAWRLVPLGSVIIGEDAGQLYLSVASASAGLIRVDDLVMIHRDAAQMSLLNTATVLGSFSRVRLDAATVTRPRPSAWVGAVGGRMMDAALAGRCQAFAQHRGEPGLMQAFTMTPGCATSRVSATYFERFGHDAAAVSG